MENMANTKAEPLLLLWDSDANVSRTMDELKPFTSALPFYALDNSQNLKRSAADCAVCAKEEAKYKCPKCSMRTCSLGCSNTHKAQKQCDGQRSIKSEWQPITGLSQFKEDTSLQDQEFMHTVENKIDKDEPKAKLQDSAHIPLNQSPRNQLQCQVHLSPTDRYLLRNAQFRRIWLHLDNKRFVSAGSRHEQFSDTLFWTSTVKFVSRISTHESSAIGYDEQQKSEEVDKINSNSQPTAAPGPLVDYGSGMDEEEEKEGEEKGVEEKQAIVDGRSCAQEEEEEGDIEMVGGELLTGGGAAGTGACSPQSSASSESTEEQQSLDWTSYTVNNIPESIRVCTLLRQFLRPKPHGIVVSPSQLDTEKLAPFKRAFDLSNGLQSQSSQAEENDNDPRSPSNESQSQVDKLGVFLEVDLSSALDNEKESCEQEEEMKFYYTVDPNQTILENLRNRHVLGHPCFVVLLKKSTEFGDLELPMVGPVEQKQLEAQRERFGGPFKGNTDRPKWQQRGGAGQQFQQRQPGRHHGGGRRNQQQQQRDQRRYRQPQIQQPMGGARGPMIYPPHPQPYFYHPYYRPPLSYPPTAGLLPPILPQPGYQLWGGQPRNSWNGGMSYNGMSQGQGHGASGTGTHQQSGQEKGSVAADEATQS